MHDLIISLCDMRNGRNSIMHQASVTYTYCIDNKKLFIYFHFCDFCGRFNIRKVKCDNDNEYKNVRILWCASELKTDVLLWAMKIDL